MGVGAVAALAARESEAEATASQGLAHVAEACAAHARVLDAAEASADTAKALRAERRAALLAQGLAAASEVSERVEAHARTVLCAYEEVEMPPAVAAPAFSTSLSTTSAEVVARVKAWTPAVRAPALGTQPGGALSPVPVLPCQTLQPQHAVKADAPASVNGMEMASMPQEGGNARGRAVDQRGFCAGPAQAGPALFPARRGAESGTAGVDVENVMPSNSGTTATAAKEKESKAPAVPKGGAPRGSSRIPAPRTRQTAAGR